MNWKAKLIKLDIGLLKEPQISFSKIITCSDFLIVKLKKWI